MKTSFQKKQRKLGNSSFQIALEKNICGKYIGNIDYVGKKQ